MNARRTLSEIVLAGVFLMTSCGHEVKSIDNVEGEVVREFFYEGYVGKGLVPDIEDTYYMFVKNKDGHTRLYTFTGRIASQYDEIYELGSKVNLPKEGVNVKLLK